MHAKKYFIDQVHIYDFSCPPKSNQFKEQVSMTWLKSGMLIFLQYSAV